MNGTRGKSTVTRLIAAALREAGIRTVAKTTGTAPRLILPDGSERPVRRRAPASIREQLWLLREARRLRAAAVVVECMAVDPELQAVCEDEMIRATIGVITNARPDHAEVMGTTVEEVARGARRDGAALSGPRHRPDRRRRHPGPRRAGRAAAVSCTPRQTRESRRRGPAGPGWRRTPASPSPWFASSASATRSPAVGCWRHAPILARSARAASRWRDAASTTSMPPPRTIRSRWASSSARRHDRAVFVFHHRADRPARLGQFCEAAPWSQAGDSVIVTGDRPDWATWRRLRAGLPGGRASFTPARAVAAELRRRLTDPPPAGVVVFCGNTKGLRVDAIVAALQQA